MKILVPVDGSEFSEQAMPAAIQIAARCNAVVHIARSHALPLAAAIAPVSGYYNDALDRETRVAEMTYLRNAAARWSSASTTVIRPFCLDAPIVEALSAHAVEHAVNLIVMTTHGRGGLSRAWLGSVADRLVRTVHVPVLLRRPSSVESALLSAARISRVLIPLDGSVLAESIIDHAIAIGSLTRAGYTLLQVVAPPIIASASATIESGAMAAQLRAEAHAYLSRQAALLRARGFDVDTRVIMQMNIAAAIVEEAVESSCDVIAMATHGRSGWSRIALGSVADKVLRSAPVPLLVMSPREQAVSKRMGA